MYKSIVRYADVFYGNGETDLPKPEGIAATWFFLNGQCGNTNPHASIPFGKMSCGLYTGGYPAGYGNHKVNYGGKTERFAAKAKGFSHMHQTGTGEIRVYYNYAPVTPLYGDLREISEEIINEEGEPGYYCATLAQSKIKAEITVDEYAAYHRYSFDGEGKLLIDFSNDGLDRSLGDGTYAFARDAHIRVESDRAISASATLHGVRMYFYAVCDGAVKTASLFDDYKPCDCKELHKDNVSERYGGFFCVNGECVLRVAVSQKSAAEAKRLAERKENFDTVRKNASLLWEKYLGRIEIDADDTTKKMFYSNFYHSIIKPAKCENGYTDFATLWDLYKTQLPLVYTLFADEGSGIQKTICDTAKRCSKVPIALLQCAHEYVDCFETQAKMLGTYTVADAYLRGLCSAEDVVDTAKLELGSDPQNEFEKMLSEGRYTHVLDVTSACCAAADAAKDIGDVKQAKNFESIAKRFAEAFDDKGLLKHGECYEGDSWNYSFRLLPDMAERIRLCGGCENFVRLADSFFGYGKAPVEQCTDIEAEYHNALLLHRFDGINNEHDMESPYVYNYAGRHDRTCEIVSAIKKYMFTDGRGGIPGNNDTGALSSWFVWSTLGIFPVSGQDKVLIGIPSVKLAKMYLSSGNLFEIKVCGSGEHVEKAVLNGTVLRDMSMTVREMMNGGKLEFYMKK